MLEKNDGVMMGRHDRMNEVGTIQPIAAIERIAREHGVAFHTDAAQSVGKILLQAERSHNTRAM